MEEALIKRTMPNSLESEQSVVGSMIMDRDAILTASEILTKDDFYHQQYGVLFEAIVELYNSGQPVDLVTLQNKLREKDVPPEVASLEYISDLVAAVPVTVNVASYAQIVKDKALLRQIIKVNQEIENDCYNGKESVTEILEKTDLFLSRLCLNIYNSSRFFLPDSFPRNAGSSMIIPAFFIISCPIFSPLTLISPSST